MELVCGQNILKLYVRSQAWRHDLFACEPGYGPDGGIIGQLCDEIEQLARVDPFFAATFGTEFHRVA